MGDLDSSGNGDEVVSPEMELERAEREWALEKKQRVVEDTPPRADHAAPH